MSFRYRGDREEEVNGVLARLVGVFSGELGGNLKGLYLHGSMAMGCFRPWSSDIDLLAVAHRPMAREEKLGLVGKVMGIAEAGDAFRQVEFSVVTAEEALRAVHPIVYILHYSSGWHEQYKRGEAELVITGGGDEDLAAHFMVIRRRGVALCGAPVEEAIGQVSREDYLKAVLYDIGGARQAILSQPMYTTLNLCRTLRYLRTGFVGSKREGGQWVMEERGMERWRGVVSAALAEYGTGVPGEYPPGELTALAEELLGRIERG